MEGGRIDWIAATAFSTEGRLGGWEEDGEEKGLGGWDDEVGTKLYLIARCIISSQSRKKSSELSCRGEGRGSDKRANCDSHISMQLPQFPFG